VLRGQRPSRWETRALYTHDLAARLWLQQCQASMGHLSHAIALDACTAALNLIRPCSVISLGSGGGCFDARLLKRMNCSAYIPIDISYYLCKRAAVDLSLFCRVPFGLVADYEEHTAFLQTNLNAAKGERRVFLFLDNLGGLDKGEANFLHILRKIMNAGDHALLSFPVGRFRKNIIPLLRSDKSSALWQLVNAMDPCRPDGIKFEPNVGVETTKSDVPGSSRLTLLTPISGARALTIARYDFQSLTKWLTNHFQFKIRKAWDSFGSLKFGLVLIGR
jgi:hypothetical protein